MKRLILAGALVAALAVPAAAAAHDGKPGHGRDVRLTVRVGVHEQRTERAPGVRFTSGVLRRYAQSACRAERESLGVDAFRAKYGNANDRDAFARCVAAQVGTALQSDRTRTRLVELATGSLSSSSATAYAVTATITGKPIAAGSLAASLTVDTTKTVTGALGTCSPATGTVTLTDSATSANTIAETVTGKLCQIGTGTSVGHVFFGRYTVASGTGVYANASGHGSLGFYQPAGGSALTAFELGTVVTG